jgi:hypothetical protein
LLTKKLWTILPRAKTIILLNFKFNGFFGGCMLKASHIAMAAALGLAPLPALATTLDFEDLINRPYFASLPVNYASIDWAANFWAFSDNQYPYTAHSGVTRIAGNGGSPGDSSFSFAAAVRFDGVWAAGAPLPFSFELYSHGHLVHTSDALTLSSTPTFLASGYAGAVDRVKIVGANGGYIFDDVSYQAAPVPESETWAMILGGLLMLGLHSRRRSTRLMK